MVGYGIFRVYGAVLIAPGAGPREDGLRIRQRLRGGGVELPAAPFNARLLLEDVVLDFPGVGLLRRILRLLLRKTFHSCQA
jgi:hypothetical protein